MATDEQRATWTRRQFLASASAAAAGASARGVWRHRQRHRHDRCPEADDAAPTGIGSTCADNERSIAAAPRHPRLRHQLRERRLQRRSPAASAAPSSGATGGQISMFYAKPVTFQPLFTSVGADQGVEQLIFGALVKVNDKLEVRSRHRGED